MMSAAAGRPGALCASRGIRAPLLPARRPVTRGTKMAVNAFKNAEKDQVMQGGLGRRRRRRSPARP